MPKKNDWLEIPANTMLNTSRWSHSEQREVPSVYVTNFTVAGRYLGTENDGQWSARIPVLRTLYTVTFDPASVKVISAIDAKIIDFKTSFIQAKIDHEDALQRAAASGRNNWVPDKPRINWDETWDGLLLERIQKLRDAGFDVTDFWRKQKIKMRKPKDLTHGEIVTKIIAAVGDEFTGITFKPGVSVWWGATTRKWW